MEAGKVVKRDGEVYVTDQVCLFKVVGDYVEWYFDHGPTPKYYRRSLADTETRALWTALKSSIELSD
jgi:hypothetical protein